MSKSLRGLAQLTCASRSRNATCRTFVLPARTHTNLTNYRRTVLIPTSTLSQVGVRTFLSWRTKSSTDTDVLNSKDSPASSASETPTPPPSTAPPTDVTSVASSTTSTPVDLASASSNAPTDLISTASSTTPADLVLPLIEVKPIQYGDFQALDLIHWTPKGFFLEVLQITQVYTGLPWWAVIIVVTVATRICFTPGIIKALKLTHYMSEHKDKLDDIKSRALQSNRTGDTFGKQMALMEQQNLVKQSGVNPISQVFFSVGQLTGQFGIFLAVRALCNLPLEQFKTGGFSYWLDLTATDPYYLFPAINVVFGWLLSTILRNDAIALKNDTTIHTSNLFRFLALISVPFLHYIPTGMNLQIVSGVAIYYLQTLILRIPAVRARVGLKPLPPIPAGTKPPTAMESLRYFGDKMKTNGIEQQEAMMANQSRRIRQQRQMRRRI